MDQWAAWNVYWRAFMLLLWVGIGAAVYWLLLIVTGVKLKDLLKHE
jgi:hypothetical protein